MLLATLPLPVTLGALTWVCVTVAGPMREEGGQTSPSLGSDPEYLQLTQAP